MHRVQTVTIIPYYLANTPPLVTPPPPTYSFDENFCASIIIDEDSDCD